jgi:hypothetical protein
MATVVFVDPSGPNEAKAKSKNNPIVAILSAGLIYLRISVVLTK